METSVFAHAIRQTWRTILFLGLGTAAFFYLTLLSSASFITEESFGEFLREPPRAIEALMGGSVNFLEPAGWIGSAMTHPIMLSLLTASALVIAAGAVATEVERGTIDLVLSRPVGRIRFLSAKAAAAVAAVTFVEAMGLGASMIARLTVDRVDTLSPGDLTMTFAGSWALFVAVAMIALLISSLSSLRGRAVGLSVAVVVVSFFVNFAALLIDALYPARFLSLFNYFQAGSVVQGEEIARVWVLAAVAAVAGAAGAWSFTARDIKR